MLLKTKYYAFLVGFNDISPHLVALITLGSYVLLGNELTVSKTFAVIALIGIIRFTIRKLPHRTIKIVDGKVALDRIENFLRLDNLNKPCKNDKNELSPIMMNNCWFSWTPDPDETSIALTDITLNIKKGSINAIIGLVGSGKSSLLNAILGELHSVKGNLFVNGNISYTAQMPFIINASVRDNIQANNKVETLLTRSMGRQDYQDNRSSKFEGNPSDTYYFAGNKYTRIDNAESPIKRDISQEDEEEFGAPAGSATSAASGASGASGCGCNNGGVSRYNVNIDINHNNSHAELTKLASVSSTDTFNHSNGPQLQSQTHDSVTHTMAVLDSR